MTFEEFRDFVTALVEVANTLYNTALFLLGIAEYIYKAFVRSVVMAIVHRAEDELYAWSRRVLVDLCG